MFLQKNLGIGLFVKECFLQWQGLKHGGVYPLVAAFSHHH
jgi:hypothetical protein